MNIFELPGPDFLRVYVVLVSVAIGAGVALRRFARPPKGNLELRMIELPPAETAYLAGGADQVVNATLGALAHRQLITVGVEARQVWVKAPAPPAELDPLERHVHSLIVRGATGIDEVRQRAAPWLEPIRTRLQHLGLLMSAGSAWRAQVLPIVLLALVLGIGITKGIIGISRGRPIDYLVILMIVTGAVLGAFLVRIPQRSHLGDQALVALRRRNAALQDTTVAKPDRVSPADLALAIGLFGPAVLAAGPLAPLGRTLGPRKRVSGPSSSCSTVSGSSCGSSCGGSGCGGGCGGGGCGGCGS